MTTESKTAEAILQEPANVNIGNRTYQVPAPTPATLIMVSKLASTLPKMTSVSPSLADILRTVKDSEAIGEIAATLVLGAKRIKEGRKKWYHLRRRSELEELSEYIMTECTNAQLKELITVCMSKMEVGDFFGITTSLSGINLINPTKEVGTIVSGRL
jgi:hypothetical protein